MNISSNIFLDRIRVFHNRLSERLWVKPLAIALVSIAAAFISKLADDSVLVEFVPEIKAEVIVTLLSVMASSMLVVATFAVSSMVAAYASASNVATPRSFPLVVRDDVSQNALSTFIGAFIFSIIALTAVKGHYFKEAGLFFVFVLTVLAFGIVIFTLVHWIDRIARLGRLGSTVDKVEKATENAFKLRQREPYLCALPVPSVRKNGTPIFSPTVGYVQNINIAALQNWAEETESYIEVAALPGTFASPDRPLVYIRSNQGDEDIEGFDKVIKSFKIGHDRMFDDDPRFGLIVLSEIAGRALSPAVNDPGTAIEIIGTNVRLFTLWNTLANEREEVEPIHDRVEVTEVSILEMFDDAFSAIARDGAGIVEVMVRLQKGLKSLASLGDTPMTNAAKHHGRLALSRAEKALDLEQDLETVRNAAEWV